MGFLIQNDYKSRIRSEVLSIIASTDAIRNDAEDFARTLMIQYLSIRFDVEKIFIEVNQWNNSNTYAENDHVWIDNAGVIEIYYALQGNTNSDPKDNSNDWKLGDKRNPTIKSKMMDIVIHQLNKTLAMDQQTSKDAYKMAIAWLKDLRDGHLADPGMPILKDEDGEDVDNLAIYGSRTKRDDSY